MVIIDEPILEATTAFPRFNLVDETGAAIAGTSLSTFTLTYYDADTLTVLNSRSAQPVLNQNGVTVDGQGLVTWTMTPDDTVLVSTTKERELHVALWTWAWASGTRTNRHEVGLYIERVSLG